MTPAESTRQLIAACQRQGLRVDVRPPLTAPKIATAARKKIPLPPESPREQAGLIIISPSTRYTADRYDNERKRDHDKYEARKAAGLCCRCDRQRARKANGELSVLCEEHLKQCRLQPQAGA